MMCYAECRGSKFATSAYLDLYNLSFSFIVEQSAMKKGQGSLLVSVPPLQLK